MDTLEVSTDIYCPPEEVFEFLLDFTGYARYSKYLEDVRRLGDGNPGTDYELVFAWWRLEYTARSRVTDIEPPNRIDWTIRNDVDAAGSWLLEPIESVDEAPKGTRVTFLVEFDPGSVDAGIVDLPRFVSIGWVVDRVTPLIRGEAERIVERVVADLEGQKREVELEVRTDRNAAIASDRRS